MVTEMSSNCVGYVLVDNDLTSVRSQIVKWLEHFGLNSEKSSIVLTTDAERSVGQLISRSSTNFTFTVRRANPQQHRSVGGAERVKENLSVLRADMNEQGYDVPFTSESLQLITTYMALTHNHFAKAPSSDLSPLEFVAARRLSKPHVAMYGMVVLAELPSSLVKDAPNETRNIEAILSLSLLLLSSSQQSWPNHCLHLQLFQLRRRLPSGNPLPPKLLLLLPACSRPTSLLLLLGSVCLFLNL